ncbi:MAG: hypothetical protein PUB91_01440 [Bacteroidales bacterium]|nr:hypothetical protein [Bacteroidales bacterium]
MKKFASAIAALAAASAVALAADQPQTRSLGESLYSISVGDVTMTIDAAHGAKILSFKRGDAEIISQLKMFNAFGSTFWTSPQSEWNWPPVAEYDRLEYQVEQTPTSLVMEGKTSERFGYSIRKKFEADPSDEAIVVTYSIVNRSDQTRKVAPWEITRVPGEGLIFFAAKSSDITPAGLMEFNDKYGAAWYSFDEAKENRKINADGKGWLAYEGNNLLLVKKFPDLKPSQPAPAEAEIQVYVNQGTSFIELESQGAYSELAPGESLNYSVKWYLVPSQGKGVPSKKLLKTVNKLVK